MMMRKHTSIWVLTVCFLSCLSMSSCGGDDELDILGIESFLNDEPQSEYVYFKNHPLPAGKGSLRVLAIGNSYTVDALYFVKDILENLGVDAETYSLYGVIHDSASLQHWCKVIRKGETVQLSYWGGQRTDEEEGTLIDLISQPWDVIVLTQYSRAAIDYRSFNPWIKQLIDCIQLYCPNTDVTLAWNMAPSYNDAVITPYSNYERWLLIAQSTKMMAENDGIDVIIPVGTAVQNARSTSLNSQSQLTRDGWHLNEGVGRYLAAYTMVQSLFAPVYGITVQNDHSQLSLHTPCEHQYPPEPVTDENRSLCHQCVMSAVQKSFEVVK